MKRQLSFWICALILLGISYNLYGQKIENPWGIGVSVGVNWQRVRKISGTSHSDGWWIFPGYVRNENTKIWGNKRGYQGGVLVKYQPIYHFSVESGLGVSSFESHVRWTTVSSYYYGDSYSGTRVEVRQFDKDYVALEIPFGARWYINPGENNDNPLKVYLDMGVIFRFPIVNNSTFENRENNVMLDGGKLDLKAYTTNIGLGFAVEQYSIAINKSFLRHENSDLNSRLWALVLTRSFKLGKK